MIYFSFCATRRVEYEGVAERAIKLWPNTVKLVKHWQGLSPRANVQKASVIKHWSNTKFRKCWDVFKVAFTLSHGQTAVERGFSVNKELLVENLQQLSLVSQRIVSDYLTDFGKFSITVPLTNALLKSCQLAHPRYTTALEMNKN